VFSPFTLSIKYLRYWATASNGRGHGIHSPFVFDFVTEVLNDRRQYYAYDTVEALREKLLLNRSTVTVEDFGAGSSTGAGVDRTIASIAKNAAKPKKYAQVLFRMVNHYQPQRILELGTSLGISTSYLALGNPRAMVLSFEGAKAIAEKALSNFSSLGLENITLVQGNFDNTLPKVLGAIDQIDMAFVDGNHRREPTIRYFQSLLPLMSPNSVIIFDDIHWSEEMELAWKEICEHPAVLLSVDLFFLGIVFINPAFKVKQHFSIRF
jgi:predicted O-methyltransferase YrrM